jgi:hypothetical protein
MNARPIPPHLDSRLSQLNDEIRDGLSRIRRQLHQLEQAEQQARQAAPRSGAPSGSPADFAATLAQAIEKADPRT